MTKMKSFRLDPWALQMMIEIKEKAKDMTEKKIVQAGIWAVWETNMGRELMGWELRELEEKYLSQFNTEETDRPQSAE